MTRVYIPKMLDKLVNPREGIILTPGPVTDMAPYSLAVFSAMRQFTTLIYLAIFLAMMKKDS